MIVYGKNLNFLCVLRSLNGCMIIDVHPWSSIHIVLLCYNCKSLLQVLQMGLLEKLSACIVFAVKLSTSLSKSKEYWIHNFAVI